MVKIRCALQAAPPFGLAIAPAAPAMLQRQLLCKPDQGMISACIEFTEPHPYTMLDAHALTLMHCNAAAADKWGRPPLVSFMMRCVPLIVAGRSGSRRRAREAGAFLRL